MKTVRVIAKSSWGARIVTERGDLVKVADQSGSSTRVVNVEATDGDCMGGDWRWSCWIEPTDADLVEIT